MTRLICANVMCCGSKIAPSALSVTNNITRILSCVSLIAFEESSKKMRHAGLWAGQRKFFGSD